MPRSVGNINTPIRMVATLLTESNGDACTRWVTRRMTLEDHRIVTGHDHTARAGEGAQPVVAGDHRRHIEDDRKRSSRLHVLVVVTGVGCQPQPAGGSVDPHGLEAIGVTADVVQRHTWRKLDIAVVELDP